MPGIWSQTLEQQTEMDLLVATFDLLIVCLFHHLKSRISFTVNTCSVLNIHMQAKYKKSCLAFASGVLFLHSASVVLMGPE